MKLNRIFSLLILVALLVSAVSVFPAAAATGVTLSMTTPPTNPAQGSTFTVDINVSATSPIFGIQYDLTWDPAYLTLTSVANTFDLYTSQMTCSVPAASFFVNPGTITSGRLEASTNSPLGATAGCTGSGRVATLTFTAVANGRSVNAFENVIILNSPSTEFPPAGPGNVGYEANALPIRVGPGPVLGVKNLTATKVTETQFTVSFVPTNTGQGTSDPSAYSIVATNTVEGSANGTIPGGILAGTDGAAITATFNLSGGATSSSVTASIPEFSASQNTLYVAGVSEQGNVPVDARFVAFLDLTLPAGIDFGFLTLGPNTVNSTLNVKCNTNYAVNLTSQRNFKMTQFNGTTYGASQLFSALQVVSAQQIVTAPPLANGSLLLTGNVAGQSQDVGENFPFYLSQVLTYEDDLLPSGQTYHDVLTFTASVTF